MTAGLAYEGLNNAGATDTDLLIVLNDNKMAIEPNVGGLHNSLLKLTTSARYNKLKSKTWTALGAGTVRDAVQRLVKAVKRFCQKQHLIPTVGHPLFWARGRSRCGTTGQYLQTAAETERPPLAPYIDYQRKGIPAGRKRPGRVACTRIV